MNIGDVKNKIAQYEREVADEAGKTVDEISRIRRVVKDAVARRAEIASKRRNREGRLREMRASHSRDASEMRVRHMQEAGEMRARHARELADLTAEIAAFDAERAINEHIAESAGVDLLAVPRIIEACAEMDDRERQLWAEYRKPKCST